MRTDRETALAEDPEGESDREGSASHQGAPGRRDRSLRRRGFLTAAGTCVGLPLIGSPGAAGSGDPVRVAATEPYRRSVRDAVRSLDRSAVDVRVVPADTRARVRDDRADVRVSGRPAPANRERSDYVVETVPIEGIAALAHDEREWRDCLDRGEIRDRWAGDAPVETWSETDGETVSELAEAADAAGRSTDSELESGRYDGARAHLVRGRRPAQYARGYGGVGYYAVDADDILADPRMAETERYTPLRKLGFVHAERSLDGTAAAFFRAVTRRGPNDHDTLTCFAESDVS